MALRLDEFLYLTPQEKQAAEKLPLDSPQRKSLLARKLAGIRVISQLNQRKGNANARRLQQ
jgi:hypothetical protein